MMDDQIKSLGKVAVLMGGRSAEREISLMSGNGVLQALRSKGVDAHTFDPAERSLAELISEKFERVFIALHGRYGEDGAIQGVLEYLNLPYTGSGVMASAIGMDKIFTKRVWQTHAISTPAYAVVKSQDDLDSIEQCLGYPMILKPPHEGSTIGITKVNNRDELLAAYQTAAKFDDVVLAEQFIQGRELTIAILGKGKDAQALPIVEIIAPQGNYDYQNKYFTDDTRYDCPAKFTPELTAQIQAMAVAAYNALECEGWARVDALVRDTDQQAFLLEINTSPGMTGHSLVPMAARAIGLSYEDLCVKLLSAASLKIKSDAKFDGKQ